MQRKWWPLKQKPVSNKSETTRPTKLEAQGPNIWVYDTTLNITSPMDKATNKGKQPEASETGTVVTSKMVPVQSTAPTSTNTSDLSNNLQLTTPSIILML